MRLTDRPTKRTDAAAMECSGSIDDDDEGSALVVIGFARRLEQENQAMRVALGIIRFSLDPDARFIADEVLAEIDQP